MPRVVLDGVTKVYGRRGAEPITALSEVNFSVLDHECLTIVGPSGSGKTTLLRMIAGLETATKGEIRINGEPVKPQPHERGVGMVFQNPALYPHLTIEQNLSFGLRVRGCARQEIARRVGEVAERLGLSARLGARPEELSGGERQRVAIGRAMAGRPNVLLLDEPLANIDPGLRTQLREDILSLREKFGTTLVYVTHDHLDALIMSDRMVVLRDGSVQQLGAPLEVYQCPANLFVAGFFGYPPINLFNGVLRWRSMRLFLESGDDAARLSSSSIERSAKTPDRFRVELGAAWTKLGLQCDGRPAVLGIRPEHIAGFPKSQQQPRESALQATVLSVQIAGADAYVRASGQGLCFVSRVPSGSSPAPGQQCEFEVNTGLACLFDPGTGQAIARP